MLRLITLMNNNINPKPSAKPREISQNHSIGFDFTTKFIAPKIQVIMEPLKYVIGLLEIGYIDISIIVVPAIL